MAQKPTMFRNSYVSSTSSSDYNDWKSRFEGYNAEPWLKLSERYAEDFQLAILQGMAVTGITCSDWNEIFRDLYHEFSPFQGMSKRYLQGQLAADWGFFAQKLAKETYKSIHYPPVCPEWLFMYGYQQADYLEDLAVYWDQIHDEYFKPWETTRLGQDSPELARLKKISQAAQREIDQVARHGAQQINR
jgi:hypothetical protein